MTDVPHDEAIEQATLGALIVQPSNILEVADLSPLAFWSDRNRAVFVAMASCVRQHGTIDAPLLRATLYEAGKLEFVGGPAYLSVLLDGGIRGVNLSAYVARLKDLEMRRVAIQGAATVAALAREEGIEAACAALKDYAKRTERASTLELLSLNMSEVMAGEIPPVPWLVEGWLGRGDRCTLAGEWGTGKSLIAMDLAISVAGNLPWLNRVTVAEPCPVIYCDEENNPANATRRLKRMVAGRSVDPEVGAGLPITYLTRNRIKLDSPRHLDALRRLLDRTKAGLLILDSMVRFFSGNENKTEEVSAFYSNCIDPLIAEFGCAVLMLDHMRKPTDGDDKVDQGHRIRGSGDKAGVSDDLWTLEGDRDSDRRTLSCRKNRWEDSLPPAMTTKWVTSEDESAAWIEATDAALQAESVIVGIVELAGDKGIRATNLYDQAKAKGIPHMTVIRTAKKLRSKGVINHRQEGKQGVRYWSNNVQLRESATAI